MQKSMRRAFAPFSLRIPATSANLGPGFDSIGIALELRLEAWVYPAKRLSLEFVEGPNAPTHGGFAETIRGAMRAVSARLPPARVLVRNSIPLGKGLGSSAAAILLGLVVAARCRRQRLTVHEIGRLASDLEGHPDNALSALYGGAVIAAARSSRAPAHIRVRLPTELRALVVVPDIDLPTPEARAVLPQAYALSDVARNTQRAALLAASLATGDLSHLSEAMRDVVHQQYRARLAPGLGEALRFRARDVLGVALSGAGPSVLAFVRSHVSWQEHGESLAQCFRRKGIEAQALHLRIAERGLVCADLRDSRVHKLKVTAALQERLAQRIE